MPTTENKSRVFIYRVFREAIAMLFWSFLIIKIFIFDIDLAAFEYFFPTHKDLFVFKFLFYLAVFAVVILIFNLKKLLHFFSYIFAYPFIVLFWKIPKVALRNWPIAIIFAPVFHDFFTSFRQIVGLYSLSILSAFLILKSNVAMVLVGSMIALSMFGFNHLFRATRKAYRSSIFSGFSGFVKEFREKIKTGIDGVDIFENSDAGKSGSAEELMEGKLSRVYTINWFFLTVSEKINEVARSRKMDLYLILTWVWSAILISCVFAFLYFGLYKIQPHSFGGNSGFSLLAFWGFSLGKMIPGGVSGISPANHIAVTINYMQGFCTLWILIILLFTILTATRERYSQDIREFVEELKLTAVAVEEQSIRVWNMAIRDVEIRLCNIRKQNSMVNWLRSLRGLPEIPLKASKE